VGAVVVNEAGDRVLLVQRGHEPSQGLWSIPGGLVNLGETVQEAAVREVREECGVDVAAGDVVAVAEVILRDDASDGAGRVRYHYVLVDLAARYLGGELAPADDADAVRWVARHELDQLPMTSGARDVLRKVLGW
jgi:ADP-ribose pyrophosphatase